MGDRNFPTSLGKATTIEELRLAAEEAFKLIAQLLGEQEEVELRPIYAAPVRPRAGMLIYADGTSWNPGSGQGVYRYSLAGAWVFLG